jgi:carbon storage regulator CsrA
MLVLSRKVNESIVLGLDENVLVRVTVVKIDESMVRLGVEARRHIQIHRAEVADALKNQVKNSTLVASQGSARSEAGAGAKQYPHGETAPEIETDSLEGMLILSRKVHEAISIGKARLTVLKIVKHQVLLGFDNVPDDWFCYRKEIYEYIVRSAAAPVPTDSGRTKSTVAKILSRASSLKAPEEIEELTAGLLALRAKRIAPVVSHDETRLLLAINEGVPVELTDRAEFLIEKRDDCSLTVEENSELLQLADEVERRGVERLEALSKLAELRGVSLRELMQSLGVAAADHG